MLPKMPTMTQETVFKTTNNDSQTLGGSNIGPIKIQAEPIPSASDIENQLHRLFLDNDNLNAFYRLCKHYCGISKSKKDSKEQFEKILYLYFISLKKQYPDDVSISYIEKIQESMENTKKLLDDFTKDGRMNNDYFKVAVSALLTHIL
jgi:hypothetical protein